MKVSLVSYEDPSQWILGKFARKMDECLKDLGIQSEILRAPTLNCDINHHIIYSGWDGVGRAVDTLMVTHIDTDFKLDSLKRQLDTAKLGICMSSPTVDTLVGLGIPANRLCYVLPAHDGLMPFRKWRIGIASRVYPDRRKREYFLSQLAMDLDPRWFHFSIMGQGWESEVRTLRERGFSVTWFEDFEYSKYLEFIPSLDKYLYMGMDEGQMGFIDALAAGVDTIVTSQGYHLDAPGGMVHPFTTYEELKQILLGLQSHSNTLISSIASWNWMDYTKKHVELWNGLVKDPVRCPPITSWYKDGIHSHSKSAQSKRNWTLTLRTQFGFKWNRAKRFAAKWKKRLMSI